MWALLCSHVQSKHAEAVKELERRQDSYMRREEQLKAQLSALIQPHDGTGGTSCSGNPCEQSTGDSSAGANSDLGSDLSLSGATGSRGNKAPKPLTLQEMQQQVGPFYS